MSIFLEFIPNIFAALAFDFILYITGASVLRVISLGFFKYQLHSYGEYKKLKGRSKNDYLIPYIVGVSFYVLIFCLIAQLN